MPPLDRERILALRRGAEQADPRGHVAIRSDDFLLLTALAVAALPPEPAPPAPTPDQEPNP